MNHALQHMFHSGAEKLTASKSKGWLLIAMLVLTAIFTFAGLDEPSTEQSVATLKAPEATLPGLDLVPPGAISEPGFSPEDHHMTNLRPHGG